MLVKPKRALQTVGAVFFRNNQLEQSEFDPCETAEAVAGRGEVGPAGTVAAVRSAAARFLEY